MSSSEVHRPPDVPSPCGGAARPAPPGGRLVDAGPEWAAAVAFLKETPAKVAARIDGLDDARLRLRPPSGFFSLAENVHHLRDIEVEGYARRLWRILREENPLLPDLDGGALAVERRYNEQPVEPALAEFAASRAASVSCLEALDAAALARTAVQENVGPVTLGALIAAWRDHDAGHLAEIEAIVAAGGRP